MRTFVSPFDVPRRFTLPIALLVAIVCAALPAAANAKRAMAPPVVGIADQHSDYINDPLFTASGVNHGRLVVGWNAIYDDAQRADMDAYLNHAHAMNIDVLLTFGNAKGDGRNRPTPQALLGVFRAIRARYPWLTSFATWNEPNIQGGAPALTARYWRALSRDCRTCTILAADLVDTNNMKQWVRKFRRAARREPRAWGLHNYVDANQFTARGTRTLLKATRGEIWLTETGGVVERHNNSLIVFETGLDHAALAIRFIFQRLIPLSPRIRRVYLYNWRAQPGPTTWDSALTNADGTPRASYLELRSQLLRIGIQGFGRPGIPVPLPVLGGELETP